MTLKELWQRIIRWFAPKGKLQYRDTRNRDAIKDAIEEDEEP